MNMFVPSSESRGDEYQPAVLRANPKSPLKCRVSSPSLDHPDVAVHQRVAVVLQANAARLGTFGNAAGGPALQLDVVLHDDPIVTHRAAGVRDFLAALELRGREIDVVRLPLKRRVTHVDLRIELLIEPAGFVVLPFEPKAVEDLKLVAILNIDPAIGSALPSGARHEGQQELDVDRVRPGEPCLRQD